MVLQEAYGFVLGHALFAIAFRDNCAFRRQKPDFHRSAGALANQITKAGLPVCSGKVVILNAAADAQSHRAGLALAPDMLQMHGAQGHGRLQVLKAVLAYILPRTGP